MSQRYFAVGKGLAWPTAHVDSMSGIPHGSPTYQE